MRAPCLPECFLERVGLNAVGAGLRQHVVGDDADALGNLKPVGDRRAVKQMIRDAITGLTMWGGRPRGAASSAPESVLGAGATLAYLKTMIPTPNLIETVWSTAAPGREAVAQNELLRTLHELSTTSGIVLPDIRESPLRLPTRRRQS